MRIDGGNAEAVANDGIRRRPASLAENVVSAAKLDDLPHGEKVTGIIERLDDLQLLFNLLGNLVRNLPIKAPARPVERLLPQPLRRCRSVGQLLRRIPITDFAERKTAPLGNFEGARYRRGIVIEELCESIRRLQCVFRIGL